jgi:hypothetical protein
LKSDGSILASNKYEPWVDPKNSASGAKLVTISKLTGKIILKNAKKKKKPTKQTNKHTKKKNKKKTNNKPTLQI